MINEEGANEQRERIAALRRAGGAPMNTCPEIGQRSWLPMLEEKGAAAPEETADTTATNRLSAASAEINAVEMKGADVSG